MKILNTSTPSDDDDGVAIRLQEIPHISKLVDIYGRWSSIIGISDGHITVTQSKFVYAASAIDDRRERYTNVAPIILEAITAYSEDVRAGRPLIGEGRAAGATRAS